MSLRLCCSLFGISRQAYYQRLEREKAQFAQLAQVKKMVVEQRMSMPRLGTRKLYFLLKDQLHANHLKVGRDKLFYFLRSEHMLVKRRKSYTKTTMSKHWLHKHPNLVKGNIFKEPERLWVSDITYLKTKEGNSYLSLITDAYSRKIMGHHLSNDLRTEGVVEALKMAIKKRIYTHPLIHHSDRGLQYCSQEYQLELASHHIQPSMTDGYDCYQNALAERINGILKEEFLLQTYNTLEDARKVIKQSIDIYNSKRPHLSLQFKTPDFIHKNSPVLLTSGES